MADFTGTSGNDALPGTTGVDTLTGRAGDDLYLVDNAADAVFEARSDGFDRVSASVSWALTAGSFVEMVTTSDNLSIAAINLTGNALAQYIYGNAGSNRLDGGGGGDVMVGLGGDDFYTIRNAADRVVESSGGGYDRVLAAASFTLEAGSEVELFTTIDNIATTAINLTGNALAQYLYGNAGSNRLDGGGGGDVMVGLGGDDFYTIRNAADRVVEAAAGGYDRVSAAANFTLEAGSEVELFTTIDNIATTAINLTGNALAQYLYGNAGSNVLDGGGGGDVMVGLGGDDFYYIRNPADRVVEAAGGGSDRVFAAANFTLEAGSEVELFTTIDNLSTTAIDLAGNEFDQFLYGNAGANTLDGKGGADVLTGFGGADSFAFTSALGGTNVDRITDFAAGVDKIRLAGDAGQPFAALASGTLLSGTLANGAAAADADDYLIYNSGTGALLYDADGNGAGAAVQFATLGTGLALTAADFTVSGAANHAPAITSGSSASEAENSAAGTIVYQAQAGDADGDRITWTLGGDDAGFLTIDALTGAVRLIAAPDFETKASYSFNVVASDSASSTPKAVVLTITDVTDATTPIINEVAAVNDACSSAQRIFWENFVIADNPNLPDDDLRSATIAGSLSVKGDRDFFSISLEAGQLLVLDVDGTTNGLDSLLRIYRPNIVEIGDNDDLVTADPGSAIQIDHNTDSQIRFRAGSSGTYYFSIESFEGKSSGDYQINVSVDRGASAAQVAQEDAEALLGGSQWDHPVLTFGFPTLASQYPESFAEPDSGFAPFNAAQQGAAAAALQLIANVTGLSFRPDAADPGNADLRYAVSALPATAYAYYPDNEGPSGLGGTAWFNPSGYNAPVCGDYAWLSILHESGHALGLKHGHEFPLAVSADHDTLEYTVMTYRSYREGGRDGYTNEQFGFPQTLMMYDIAALQKLYGANFGYHAGDTVYRWNPSTGEMSIDGVGQGAPGANRVFMTLWDGGGNDTYDLSNYGEFNATIDLRPGEWVTTSAAQRANLGEGHIARGNVANALLFDGSPMSLIENAIGGSGSNYIIANQAANHLTGNGGNDIFIWKSIADVGAGALADTILDFTSGSDKVSLNEMDAVPGTRETDPFHFIGTDAFHNVAGELRYEVQGGDAHIFADRDGNGIADFEIVLNHVMILTQADFLP